MESFLKKNLFWSIGTAACIVNAASWLWIHFKVPKGAFPFILHYNIYFGRDLLGERLALFQIPLAGFVILALNFLLGYLLLAKDKTLAWVVMGATLALQLLVFYASSIIVSINS